ncbi:hypothetical protein [Streptomyces montanisoli]|uniref:Uncharacterized protein n=1 Tax=Streptomyces montanisoli TaxID=2798581 RepID=A0A940MLN9_9ACTN|nr:hypothetical protein [Streptomyces montanisoli]MBP0460728.1 hypothetical protein [Streptomyces montanisoli]
MATLQSQAGNAAVAKALGTRRPAPRATAARAGLAVQRAVWDFMPGASYSGHGVGHMHSWQNQESKEIRSSSELGIQGQDKPIIGDRYDEATRSVHSSSNAVFSAKGKVPQEEFESREKATRAALVEAKRYVAQALAMLEQCNGQPAGALLTGLQSGFPAFRAASAPERADFVRHVSDVVRRIKQGLDANGLQIALASADQGPLGAQGWVEQNLGERFRGPNMRHETPPALFERSGPIHLLKPGQTPWYIVHEASHRFAGTLDYQYSPRDDELVKDRVADGMKNHDAETAAKLETEHLDERKVGDPNSYAGKDVPGKATNWYAMGRRSLMNADSYAQFILIATGAPAPRTP